MFSLLHPPAPVVVEETETVIIETPAADAVVTGTDAAAMHAAPAADAAHGAVAADAVHGAATHGAETAVGMPQLDFSTFPNQIFWLLVTLAVIYWVLSRIALPRIGGVLADRQGAITGDLMAAEEFKQKAKEAEAAYEKALADARSEAGKIVAANRAEIQKELDAAIAHADAEIAARTAESEKKITAIRASALEDARSVARDVTGELVTAMGGSADAGAVEAAVDARLAKGAA